MGFGIKTDNKGTATIPPVIGDNPAVTPINEQPIKPAEEKLAEKKYVDDTFHNQTGVNVDRFPQIIKDLKGFAEGSPITVTYYKEHYSETDIKGRLNTEESMHHAHKSVLKINNFEIRMISALQYTHDTGEAVSKMTGEAYTYPGFDPEIGDRMILEIDTGKYGLFRITKQPIRMSIRASTYFKISFDFLEYVTEELMKQIELGVCDVAYFDKSRFLNEPGALLVHDEVVELLFLEKQRAKMIHYFQQKFLDNQIMYSFMRPDEVYDPYVTDFMMKILEFSELGTSAMQLYQGAPYLEDSIWRAFLDPNLPLESVPSSTTKAKYVLGSKSVLANSLINKFYLKWVDSQSLAEYLDGLINSEEEEEGTEGEITPDPSVPELTDDDEADQELGDLLLHIHPHYTECPLMDGESSSSVGGVGDAISYILGDVGSDYFKLVTGFLLERKIDNLTRLHTCIENVWKETKIQQFYHMPVLCFLAATAMRYVHHSEGIFEP